MKSSISVCVTRNLAASENVALPVTRQSISIGTSPIDTAIELSMFATLKAISGTGLLSGENIYHFR